MPKKKQRKPMIHKDYLYTVLEAAERLMVNPETIRRYIREKKIKTHGKDKTAYQICGKELQKLRGRLNT